MSTNTHNNNHNGIISQMSAIDLLLSDGHHPPFQIRNAFFIQHLRGGVLRLENGPVFFALNGLHSKLIDVLLAGGTQALGGGGRFALCCGAQR